LIAVRTSSMLWGTAKQRDRSQIFCDEEGMPQSYEKTIFSKLRFIDKLPSKMDSKFKNGYGGAHMKWTKGSHLLIESFQQHVDLFLAHLNKFSTYLAVNDERILHLLIAKYAKGDIAYFKNCVCVGLRRGQDFKGKSRLTNVALNRAKKEHFPNNNVLLISDVKTVAKTVDGVDIAFDYTLVDEVDMIQFHLARLCPNMILSDSTFHVWMAYFMQDTFGMDSKVVCFKLTDVTNRHLALPNWIQMNYWEGAGGPDIC